MSEPMTTVEIEDVLSSIRRLVSEDLRPTHKLVSAALQKGASKLILTPALRIVADVRSALPEGDGGIDDPRDLQTVLLDIEATEDEVSAEVMPIFGSVRLSDAALQPGRLTQSVSDLAGYDADFLTTAMSRINGLSNVENDASAPVEGIEAVVAAVGAAVGPDEWEPDGGEPAPQAPSWTDTVWNTDVEAEPEDSAQKLAPLLLGSAATPEDDLIGDTSTLDLVTDGQDFSQEMADQSAFIGVDSLVFRDARETTVSAEDDLDDTSSFISEDILREIVRDMIREELQGNLGERITRNVRKLVRAEINRALASHNYHDVANRG